MTKGSKSSGSGNSKSTSVSYSDLTQSLSYPSTSGYQGLPSLNPNPVSNRGNRYILGKLEESLYNIGQKREYNEKDDKPPKPFQIVCPTCRRPMGGEQNSDYGAKPQTYKIKPQNYRMN